MKTYLPFFSMILLLLVMGYIKPVESSDIPQNHIEPVYITEIVDAKNYHVEFVEIFNASSQDISLSSWQLEETRTHDLSKTGIITVTQLSGIIPAQGFVLIVRNETKEAFEKYFSLSLDSNVTYINSKNQLKINKTYQKFVLKKSLTLVDNHEGTFLTSKKRMAVRTDLSQFNKASFNMSPVSIENASPGWLTKKQMLMMGDIKAVQTSKVSKNHIEPVYITEIVDAKNYHVEFVEIFNASSQNISLFSWQLEETRTHDLSKTGITTVTQLSGIIPAHGFVLIVRNETKEAFKKYFSLSLDSNVTYINSKNQLKINKTYQKFVLKKGSTPIDNHEGTFLTSKKRMAIRTDLSQFNEASFNMSPVSIENASPGWLTKKQMLMMGDIKAVQTSKVSKNHIEPVYITEIVDAKNYHIEFVELFNASSQDISLSSWQLEETRTHDLSKTGITTVTQLSGIIPAHGFVLIVRNETKEAFEKYFSLSLDSNVTYINSKNQLQINKTYQKFVLKKSLTLVDNHEGTFLTSKKRMAVRMDLSQFNKASFNMSPVSIEDASPGWLTKKQMLMMGDIKAVQTSKVSKNHIEPVYITEIVDAKNYHVEFVELFNASSQDISLSSWQLEETRTHDLSKTGITTVTQLSGIIPAHGFVLIVRNETKEAFEKYFSLSLDSNVTYINSKNQLKINKTYQKFVLKKGSTPIDNHEGTFLTSKKRMAIRTDLSQFNEASFNMSPISIEDASPGWLTKKQIVLITKKHGLTDETLLTNQVSDIVRAYYASVYGKTGKALKTALHKIIIKHKKLRYRDAWKALKETDQDHNHPNNVILLYKQTSQPENLKGKGPDNWSREQVWPNSHGQFGIKKGPGTDLHHIKPSDVTVNRARGRLDFDNGGTIFREAPLCKKDHDSWEPPTAVKGDIARMLFYMDVRYEGKSKGIDLELVDYTGTNGPRLGKLSTLIEWHKQDPVSDFERLRNDKIYELQGNRNPFIDYPQWVFEIW